ncbi:MAG: PD-(D/E)XK nuclease family protein [Planctomycetota bacterium]
MRHFGNAGDGGPPDLGHVAVVLPGARAGRRLAELLVDAAPGGDDGGGGAVVLPKIVTLGPLTEMILRMDRSVASSVQRHVAWCRALADTGAEELTKFMIDPPSSKQPMAFAALAEQLDRLHTELAGHGLAFADVATRGDALAEFDEADRWAALAEVQSRYRQHLFEGRLDDPHDARRKALEAGGACMEGPIVLVGAADINPVQREALERVADQVTALVHAPESLSDRFDAWGALEVEPWSQGEVEMDEDCLRIAARFGAQADEVVAALGRLPEGFAPEQITLGVADDSLAPILRQRLLEHGVPVRYASGDSVGRTAPLRLLGALADWLERQSFADFATLLRHPDVQRDLDELIPEPDAVEDWITLMDRYYADHLQGRLTGSWLGKEETRASLKRVYDAVGAMAGELTDKPRALDGWAQPILDVVLRVYGREPLDRTDTGQRVVLEALDHVLAVLNDIGELTGGFAPRVSAAEALRLVIRQVSEADIAPQAEDEAVEMLGPLEWRLDDAPALIVTGFNEGFFPASVSADAFLPDRLRASLGILDNARRYARDAYSLAAILASTEHVTLIASRLSAAGDPQPPSRLYFACDDRAAVRRVSSYFDDSPSRVESLVLTGSPRDQSDLPIPELPPLTSPIESLSVTAFRDYLACPYRFYLRRVLGLDAIDDHIEELDGGAFGNLAHDVLNDFAHSDAAESTSIGRIEKYLSDRLDRHFRYQYGKASLAAVALQVEQLRRRLQAFAKWQAERAEQGWRIEHSELEISDQDPAKLIVEGEPFGVYGRIDRVDLNVNTGERFIIDYKTSDSGKSPKQTHRRKDDWIDLQLPLYRHLLAHHFETQSEGDFDVSGVGLGYVVLPKDTKKTGLLEAGWSPSELCEADDKARWVIGNLRRGEFSEPKTPPPPFYEAYAEICQEGRLDHEPAEVEEDFNGEGGDE